MYAKRRIEFVIEDAIKRCANEVGVEVKSAWKFAHNEDSPSMELKYDIHFADEASRDKFSEHFNKHYGSILNLDVVPSENLIEVEDGDFECDEIGCLTVTSDMVQENGCIAVLFMHWHTGGSEYDEEVSFEDKESAVFKSACKENSIVGLYCEKYGISVEGSFEKDKEVISDDEYEWGEVDLDYWRTWDPSITFDEE